MATLKDISKITGVSITNVSKVLNNDFSKVSETTKDNILATAAEMNYRPNRIARSLVKKESKIIGLMIPDITNPYYSEVSKGVMETCEANDYKVFLGNTASDGAKEGDFIQTFKDYGTDGVILYGRLHNADGHIREIIEEELNFVTIDNYHEGNYRVYVNEYKGTYDMTGYILSQGHRGVAFLGSNMYEAAEDNFRRLGYLNAIRDNGLHSDKNLIKLGDYTHEYGYKAAMELLKNGPEFTAIVCANDMIAFGAMNAIAEMGKKVPDDISVSGFDDIYFSSITNPPLTTVRQPAYLLGSKAMEMLLGIINGIVEENEMSFDPEIVIRDSIRKR